MYVFSIAYHLSFTQLANTCHTSSVSGVSTEIICNSLTLCPLSAHEFGKKSFLKRIQSTTFKSFAR